jgi:hypothetical protein
MSGKNRDVILRSFLSIWYRTYPKDGANVGLISGVSKTYVLLHYYKDDLILNLFTVTPVTLHSNCLGGFRLCLRNSSFPYKAFTGLGVWMTTA